MLLKTAHPKPKNLMPDRVMVEGTLWTMTKGAIEFLKDFVEK